MQLQKFLHNAGVRAVFIALFLFFLPAAAFALTDQERIEQLRQQIEALEEQAKQYKTSIASERAKAVSLQREISILKGEIKSLETQIYLTDKKIDKTTIEITQVEGSILDTENKIERQKEAIGRLLLVLDQRDDERLLETLMKHATLSEFLREQQYVANLNDELLALIGNLQTTRNGLERERDSLEGKKTELEILNRDQSAKKNSLSGAKNLKDGLLTKTKGQEAQYQKLLADVERKKAEFFTELQILEKNIIVGGLYILRITAESVPPRGTKLLQWPEDDYFITQGYGCTKYARCGRSSGPYAGAPHNGIDIAAGYGSTISAAADGTIVANGKNKGWGNWLAIKHARNLVTVYGHLSGFAMPVGAQVKAGDTIGYEGDTGNVTGSHLHLSLYRDFFTYDRNGELHFNYFEGSLNPLDYL